MSRKGKKKTTKDVVTKMGAPTKYNDQVPVKLKAYFSTITTVKILEKEYPRFNSIEGFCGSIQISKETFYQWLKIHSHLTDAYKIAKANQADQLMQLASNRIFDAGYAKLLTVNCTDLREKPVEDEDDSKKIQDVVIDDQDTKL